MPPLILRRRYVSPRRHCRHRLTFQTLLIFIMPPILFSDAYHDVSSSFRCRRRRFHVIRCFR
jgi:hypothetical protein